MGLARRIRFSRPDPFSHRQNGGLILGDVPFSGGGFFMVFGLPRLHGGSVAALLLLLPMVVVLPLKLLSGSNTVGALHFMCRILSVCLSVCLSVSVGAMGNIQLQKRLSPFAATANSPVQGDSGMLAFAETDILLPWRSAICISRLFFHGGVCSRDEEALSTTRQCIGAGHGPSDSQGDGQKINDNK
jgi:hypothetical protein